MNRSHSLGTQFGVYEGQQSFPEQLISLQLTLVTFSDKEHCCAEEYCLRLKNSTILGRE